MARLPEPTAGLVIRYSYLWRSEHQRGLEEGRKDRPCAIVLVARTDNRSTIVTVLPISHHPPSGTVSAIEIPTDTKRRLGLDGERSWIVLTEANRFSLAWPGHPQGQPRRRRQLRVRSYPVQFVLACERNFPG